MQIEGNISRLGDCARHRLPEPRKNEVVDFPDVLRARRSGGGELARTWCGRGIGS